MSRKKRFKMFSNSVDVISSKWTNRSPVTSPNHLYEEVKILIYFSKILGVEPVFKDEDGGFYFKLTSGIAMYSVLLFILLSVIAGYTLNTVVRILRDFDMDFDDAVVMYAALAYMGFHMLSFYTFCEGDKIAKYYTAWRDFEASYYRATKKPLSCEMKNLQYVFLFMSCCLSATFLYLIQTTISALNEEYHLKMTSLEFASVYFIFLYYLWVILAFEANWFFLTLGIRKSAGILLNDLQDNRFRSHFFEEIYKLWLDLSKLTNALGNAFSWSSLYFLAYMFLMIMGSSYILITSLSTSKTNEKAIYSIASLSCFLMFGLIADCGHRTSVAVGDEFKNALLEILPYERDPIMKRELKWFYQVISFNPPVISFSGYIKLRRSFNVSMLGNLVTYMVVMLQFRSTAYQQPENGSVMSSVTSS